MHSLDFKSYLQQAYKTHPTLTEAFHQLSGSALYESSATAAFLPTINFSSGVQSSNQNPREATNHSNFFTGINSSYVNPSNINHGWKNGIDLSYNIFNNFRDVEQFNRTIKNAQQAFYTFKSAEIQFIIGATNAYLELIKTSKIINHRIASYNSLLENFNNINRKFEIDDASISDLEQSRARLAIADADLTTGKLQGEQALAEFVAYYGQNNFEALELLNALGEFEKNETSLVKQAHENSSYRLASYYGYLASKSEYQVALLEFGVKIDLSASIDDQRSITKTRGTAPESASRNLTKTIGAQLTIPLYNPSSSAQINQKYEAMRKEEQSLLKTERELTRDIKKAYANYLNAESQIKAYEVAVKSAEISLDTIRKQKNLGLKLVIDVLEAEKELINVQVYLEQSRIDKIKYHYEILGRIGVLNSSLFGIDNEFNYKVSEAMENAAWQNMPSLFTLIQRGY